MKCNAKQQGPKDSPISKQTEKEKSKVSWLDPPNICYALLSLQVVAC